MRNKSESKSVIGPYRVGQRVAGAWEYTIEVAKWASGCGGDADRQTLEKAIEAIARDYLAQHSVAYEAAKRADFAAWANEGQMKHECAGQRSDAIEWISCDCGDNAGYVMKKARTKGE